MATVIDAALRDQLLERRHRLETAVVVDEDAQLRSLLEEVDAALARPFRPAWQGRRGKRGLACSAGPISATAACATSSTRSTA